MKQQSFVDMEYANRKRKTKPAINTAAQARKNFSTP